MHMHRDGRVAYVVLGMNFQYKKVKHMKFVHALLVTVLLVEQAFATDIVATIGQLKSNDYAERQAARNELFAAAADSTQPDKTIPSQVEQLENAYMSGAENSELPIESRLYLIELIGAFGSEISIDRLERLLHHKDKRLVDASRRALLSIRPAELEANLSHTLESDPALTVLSDFERMIKSSLPEAQHKLESCLKNPNLPGSLYVMIAALESEQVNLITATVEALAKLSLNQQFVLIHSIASANLTEVEPNLLQLLEQTEAKFLRKAVVYALSIIGSDKSFEALYDEFRADPSIDNNQALARLNAMSVDTKALSDLKNGNLEEKIAAIGILSLRNTDGAVDVVNELVKDLDQLDSEFRKAALNALQLLGNKTSVGYLLDYIVSGGQHTRACQVCLSKLCMRIGSADLQWKNYFLPALQNAGTKACKDAIVSILFAVPCEQSLEFLENMLLDVDTPHFKAGISSLRRWPRMNDFLSCRVWLRLYEAGRLDTSLSERAFTVFKKNLLLRDGH